MAEAKLTGMLHIDSLDKWLDTSLKERKAAKIDAAIIEVVLPHLYSIIDRLLDGNADKKLIVDARKILPRGYKHSFEKPKENT